MKQIYDIRDQMPKFSANFFKPYEYQPYPRMMVDKTNPAKPKPYLDELGKPKAVHSEEEEAAFWASLAPKSSVQAVETPKAIEVLIAAVEKPVARHQFEAIDPATVNAAPKRRGRPPSVKLPADLK